VEAALTTGGHIMTDECTPVQVSRRIGARAASIFAILADPRRHMDLDGSGMLRGAVDSEPVAGAGDVFAMKMYFEPLGDYVMLNRVFAFEPERLIGWEPAPGDAVSAQAGTFTIGVPAGQRWSFELTPAGPGTTIVTETYDCSAAPGHLREAVGEIWIEAMTETLARLEAAAQASTSQ
jgi:hypothetical protein